MIKKISLFSLASAVFITGSSGYFSPVISG